MILAFAASEKLQLAATIIAAITTLIALANIAVARGNERRRSQPIVIAHEARNRRFAPSSTAAMWVVDAYLTSEGGGPAFNVRFGVEFAGVRYPYRLTVDDPDSGNIQRIVSPCQRRPEGGAWSIPIKSFSMWGRAAESDGDLDAKRIYWARYENAQRHTWETRNPGDRSAKLDIRRVRWPKRHERREQRIAHNAQARDEEWLRKALADLRAEATPGPAPD